MARNRFFTFTWVVLVYNLATILWGAYVRASGSGAGCGSHWPLCNGAVIPRDAEAATLVEFTHRLMSGLALILIANLVRLAFRLYPRHHPVRAGAVWSGFFIITEALVGAGLVLFELVADNASMARALFMAVHLANTFLLLAALTLTTWWAAGGERITLRGHGWIGGMLLLGWLGTMLVGVSGAVTALGDTLFPSASLAEGLRADLSPTSHVLIRLRLLHPTLAVVGAIYVVLLANFTYVQRRSRQVQVLFRIVVLLVVVQMVAGVVNVFLLAPIPMQLIHLLLADLLWIALVLLSAAALSISHVAAGKPATTERAPALVGSGN